MYKFKKKSLALLISVALLLTFTVSGTVAYLVDGTGELVNTFTPSTVSSSITEDPFDRETKSNVKVIVTGNLEVKVRATIVVTWQDDDGNIAPVAPVAGVDYEMTINTTSWKKNGDYYYLNDTIQATEAGTHTPVLINTCVVKASKEGYRLVVDILGSCIQSNIDWPN